MKTIAVIACLLSITFAYSYAEVQIPESIKDETKQLHSQNMLDEKTVMSLLTDLSDQKIIKNTHSAKQIYSVPASGSTDFIKISGRINEFGKTAQVNLNILSPDGEMNNLSSPLLETGQYSTLYPIDWKSQLGSYKVVTEFAGETKLVSFFHLTQSKLPYTNFPPWIITAFEWWAEDQFSDAELSLLDSTFSKLGTNHSIRANSTCTSSCNYW